MVFVKDVEKVQELYLTKCNEKFTKGAFLLVKYDLKQNDVTKYVKL